MPNTDYTDYTDYTVGYIISEDNVNFYQQTTYMPNIDYTDYRVGYIISEDNVSVIFWDDIAHSGISAISVWHVGNMLI